ncbi:IPT/TIG domain protein [Neobacillus drentensis]|uniref:PKD domain-containing protein n=1 Tax=Neobacillus drentensis TaxID=220684 RepID=UPI003002939E
MEPRKSIHSRKKTITKRISLKRIFLVCLSLLVLLSGGLYWEYWAEAETVPPDLPRLSKVGPIDPNNGFPVWYKDSDKDPTVPATRLQLCLDKDDPYCGFLPGDIPDETKPISFPDNFPEELFYQLASADFDLPNGGRAVGTFGLEATWANGIVQKGDQIVFGRIRFRISGLVTGEKYTITHPYGVDSIVATSVDKKDPTNPDGEIRFVEDIGVSGGFTAAMGSRIGRFLKWDKGEAPPGYIGDPNEEHTITGGFNGQNVFRIEGPGIGNACPEGQTNCAQTDKFSLMGKIAATAGVDVVRATYSRKLDKDKNPIAGGTIDVFANTEGDKPDGYDIEVTTVGAEDKPIRMKGANGQYFARIPFTTDSPPNINVSNVTDKPVTIKDDLPVVDKITGSASYNIAGNALIVSAESSDKVNNPELKVEEFDKVVTGTKSAIAVNYVPSTITITSGRGGSVTIPVDIVGDPLVAIAGSPQTVQVGDVVTLNGNQSIGVVDGTTTIKWTQLSPGATPVNLTGADTLTPTFTAATGMGVLEFQLELINPDGLTSTSTVKVKVEDKAAPLPVADAGDDQKVTQGKPVTLDGSGSENAVGYTWVQVKDPNVPTVTLDKADSVHPTFTFPKKNVALKFNLQVKGENGTIVSDEMTISTDPDQPVIISAQYRTRISEWRIDGKTDIVGPGVTIAIDLEYKNSKGEQIVQNLGKADVDVAGVWRFRSILSKIVLPTGNNYKIKISSSSGGTKEYIGNVVRK